MINSKNFYDIASSNPKQIKSKFDQLLSLEKSFSEIETFPAYKGIYFLYLTSNESLLYVGAAYKGKRTIKIDVASIFRMEREVTALEEK